MFDWVNIPATITVQVTNVTISFCLFSNKLMVTRVGICSGHWKTLVGGEKDIMSNKIILSWREE